MVTKKPKKGKKGKRREKAGKNALGEKRAKQREKSLKMVVFLAKFFIIFTILSVIIDNLELSFFTGWLAAASGSPLGMDAVGNIVLVDGQRFAVTNACTGLVSSAILASVIFALKKPEMGKKILLFATGLVVLLVANVPRIMLVLWSAALGLDAGMVHVATWFLMSAIILALWYYGTKWYAGIRDFGELV